MRAFTREEVRAAIERSEHCLQCGAELRIVCRVPVKVVEGGEPTAPFCSDCVEEIAPGKAKAAESCGGCKRPVRRHRHQGHHVFCSRRCYAAIHAAVRRKPLPTDRPCSWCGQNFTPRRKETTCCELHRKKEWRRRRKNAQALVVSLNDEHRRTGKLVSRCAVCRHPISAPEGSECAVCQEFRADREQMNKSGLDPFDHPPATNPQSYYPLVDLVAA